MNKKMSVMGVGGKIGGVLVASVAITEGINYLSGSVFGITGDYHTLVIVAVAMMAVGFGLNLTAAFGMLSAHSKGKLATGGFYSVFLNPMYTFMLLITVPGLLLLLNSWLVLLAIIPTFIAFKKFAKEEEKYLEEKFGPQYKSYKEKVLFKFL